jgi:hypothetical protein
MPDDNPKADQEGLLRYLLQQQQQQQQQQQEIMLRTQYNGLPTAAGAAVSTMLHNDPMGLRNLLLDPPSLHLTSRAQLLQSLLAAEQREIQQRQLLLTLQGQWRAELPHTFTAPSDQTYGLLAEAATLPSLSVSALSASLNSDAFARSSRLVDQVAREHLQVPTAATATAAGSTTNMSPKKRSFEETQAFLLPKDSSTIHSTTTASHEGPPLPSAAASQPPPKKKPASKKAKKVAAVPTERRKDTKWMTMLETLKQYKAEHGNCIVPRGYAPNPRLASWVAEQRKQYKLMTDGKPTSITKERVAKLEELDFAWNAQEAAWKRHVDALRAFKDEHGHCHVPLSDPAFPKLGLWVKEQRRHYALMMHGRPSHMTEARAKELSELGFCWDTHEATWLDRFRQLKAYKEEHGDCLVPAHWEPNPKLGTWVSHQRRQYRKYIFGKESHITHDRIRQLNEIGFHWDMGSRPNEDLDDDEDDEESDASSLSSSVSSSNNESVASGSLPPRKRHRFVK